MITKHNVKAGGVTTVLTAGALVAAGQEMLRESQTESARPQRRDTGSDQQRQANQPATPAEIIGRMGYPLYR